MYYPLCVLNSFQINSEVRIHDYVITYISYAGMLATVLLPCISNGCYLSLLLTIIVLCCPFFLVVWANPRYSSDAV